jgi:ferritin-like metal-binding protein YciE
MPSRKDKRDLPKSIRAVISGSCKFIASAPQIATISKLETLAMLIQCPFSMARLWLVGWEQFITLPTMKNFEQPSPNSPEEESSTVSEDLNALFLDELADLYNAENQLTQALPKMIEAARSGELKTALESHLEETQDHVTRLEEAAASLDEKLQSRTCAAMQGLIREASELLEEQKDKSSLDAAIIAAGQKVEHYEIASYGTVVAWAERLGYDDAAELLKSTLEEEEAADEKLTDIAETLANEDASEL